MLEGLTKCEDDLLDVPSYGKPLGKAILQGRRKLFCPHVHTALRMRGKKKRHKKKTTVVRPKPVRPGRLRRPWIVRFSGTCKVESSTPGEPAAFFDSENVEELVLKGSIKLCAEFANFIESQDVATL